MTRRKVAGGKSSSSRRNSGGRRLILKPLHILRAIVTYLLVHIRQREKIAQEITAKIASLNGPIELDLLQNFEAPTFSMLFFYVIRRVSFIYSVVFWKRMIRLIFLR